MVRRGYADGPFGQIHYQDTGGGDIPLVLCHQSPLTSRQFDRVYSLLAENGIRAIGIDTPGYGMSDPPHSPPTIEDYAAALPAVLDHLGLNSSHFCGHHTGCKIVMAAALAFPERARSLIFSGPAPMSQEEQQSYIDTVLAKEKAFAPKPDGSHFSELFVERLPWIKDAEDGLELCHSYIVQALMGLGPLWYGHNASFRYDGAAALAKLTQPGLLIFNTGDVLFPLAEKSRKICPQFSYVELEGGGVDITDQDPHGWTKEVAAFLHAQS